MTKKPKIKKIVCGECDKENCNKPSGWHLSYWVRTRTIKELEFGGEDGAPSLMQATLNDKEMLSNLCAELGWNGGTIHQIKEEIIKLTKENI